MPIANKFYGLSLKGLRHYPDINLFYNVVSDAIKLAEKEKVIIPYIYPICSNPRIISFPITFNAYKLMLNRRI